MAHLILIVAWLLAYGSGVVFAAQGEELRRTHPGIQGGVLVFL